MSKFNKELVDKLANDLLIGLTEKENALVLNEFDIIDKNMEIISNFPNISNVEAMTHCLDNFEYTLRSDEAKESNNIEELLQNCDRYYEREVEVPKVVEN